MRGLSWLRRIGWIGFRFAVLAVGVCSGCACRTRVEQDVWTPEVRDSEAFLVTDPDLVETRDRLIRYYYISETQSPIGVDVLQSCASAHLRHVLWMIRHHPDAAVLGRPEGSHFGWLTQSETMRLAISWRLAAMGRPQDARVLNNALACELFASPGPNDDYADLWRAQLNSLRNKAQTKPGP
jgi:hypothetical protein